MGTLYASQSAAGYNASPPPDDGSQGANNQITWGPTIKAKLADPIKTLADAINSQLTTTLDLSPRAISTNDSAVASDHWRTLQVTGTTTITLSDAATMTNKYVVGIANLGTGTVTVTRATGANTVNGTAADFTLAPKQAVMLGVNQAANGYNILAHSLASGASINTIQATTSVVTPLVGTSTAVDFGINTGGTTKWVFGGASPFSLLPTSDNTTMIGGPSNRINAVFTPIIDSGTAGSLSLRTNNGRTAFEVADGGVATVNWIQAFGGGSGGQSVVLRAFGGDTNVGFYLDSRGNESIYARTNGGASTQLSILHTASSTRNITVTGSNGGNPTISTTAGSLAITPAVVLGSSLSFSGTVASTGTIRMAANDAPQVRNNGNSADMFLPVYQTINSVADVLVCGDGNSNGMLGKARSKAGAPTTSDIPAGDWAVWRDTTGATTKLYYNNAGAIQSVALA